MRKPDSERRRRLSLMLWLLSFLFALRVLGQAVQRWLPQPGLPPFDSFQGSNLPYGVLLSLQLVILGVMTRSARQVQQGTLRPSSRTGRALAWFGGVYLGGSVARVVIGAAVASASPWFRAWIPAAFHLVLAAYVLTLARCHRQPAKQNDEHGT